jgi:hypothetical protein
MPLNAAASKLDPNSQSPQMPTRATGSKMQGTPGVFVGKPAPLKYQNALPVEHESEILSMTDNEVQNTKYCSENYLKQDLEETCKLLSIYCNIQRRLVLKYQS